MAISRAEIERRRQEAAHARATGQSKTVRRRCMVDGCPDYGQWSVCESEQAARVEGFRHYMRNHYVRPGA